jgi:hypothetical protein
MGRVRRNRLALVEEVYGYAMQDGKYLRRPESHYLDLVVDETPVRDRAADTTDLVTVLNRAWLPGVAEAVEVLQGHRPHPDLGPDRVALLVCGVCGDLDCGALTVRLDVTDSEVRWSDWSWVDHQGERDAQSPSGERIEPVVFDRTDYQACLERSVDRLADMPYDELDHTGKRFLWPWEWGWRMP